MPVRARILIATAKPGFAALEGMFEPDADVTYAYTLGEAIHHLGASSIDLVLATIHFDESRMFDFLRYARAVSPQIPIVCTRVLDTKLTGSLLDAVTIAVESLGATFIDRYALGETLGDETGDEEFKKRVLERLAK
jgi:hypothetical protein